MAFSCSDFTDRVVDLMDELDMIRPDDIAMDNPTAQARLVERALLRMSDALKAAASLAQKANDAHIDLAAEGGALKELLAAIKPRYLVAENYAHCFIGRTASTVRWVMDLESGELVDAYVDAGRNWRPLDRDAMRDLLEDLRDNDVRTDPHGFGATWASALPSWAKRGAAASTQAAAAVA